MAVTKKDVSLAEALGAYLSYTPNYTETDAFHSDLRTLNHTLLRDSISECANAEKVPLTASPQTKRQKIHYVYTRKVKELAALYPFIFSLENALRSLAAERYNEVFKDPYWWRIILNAVLSGREANHFPVQADKKKRVRATPVNPLFIKEAIYVCNQMTRPQREALMAEDAPATLFYEKLSLKGLADIIYADYGLCFVGNITKSDFKTYMNTVHVARNEIFHGNPIKNRQDVFNACERVLDAVNFHTGTFDEALRDTALTRPTSSLPRTDKHCIPPLP